MVRPIREESNYPKEPIQPKKTDALEAIKNKTTKIVGRLHPSAAAGPKAHSYAKQEPEDPRMAAIAKQLPKILKK